MLRLGAHSGRQADRCRPVSAVNSDNYCRRPGRHAAPALFTVARKGYGRLLLVVPQAPPGILAAPRLPHEGRRTLARRCVGEGQPFVLLHPDSVEAVAARCTRGAFSTNIPWDRGLWAAALARSIRGPGSTSAILQPSRLRNAPCSMAESWLGDRRPNGRWSGQFRARSSQMRAVADHRARPGASNARA